MIPLTWQVNGYEIMFYVLHFSLTCYNSFDVRVALMTHNSVGATT